MAARGEYELLPHEEIRRLRQELDELRGHQNVPGSENVQDSIKKLSQYLEDLLVVFEKASEDLKEEDKESEIIAKKINPIFDRLTAIEEQNSKIAKAMVAINGMVDGKISEITAKSEALQTSADAVNNNLQQIMSKLDDMGHQQSMMSTKMATPPPISQAPMPPPPTAKETAEKKEGFHLFKH